MSNLAETLSDALVINGDRAFVGSTHGGAPKLSSDIVSQLKQIARKNGVWYEGRGGDVAPFENLFGSKKVYRGSWDEEFVFGETEGYPVEFLAPLFSNVKENKTVEAFISPGMSIVDSLVKNQSRKKYFTDRSYTAKDVSKFLQYGGDDLVALAQKPATPANTQQFFAAGEKLMWSSGSTQLRKLADKFNTIRDAAIADEKGVFVVGRDHLPALRKMSAA